MKVSRIPQKVLFQKGDILDPVQKTKTPGDLLVINGEIVDIGRINTPDDAIVYDCKDDDLVCVLLEKPI